jgi:hypothetical protein
VVLDKAHDAVRLRELHELVVVRERLHRGLGDQDVQLALDRVLADVVVSVCRAISRPPKGLLLG